MLDQVGPGNISVVSPPDPNYHTAQAPFAGASGGHQQYEDAPPDYYEGFANSAFSDGAVRRGEQGLQHGFDESRRKHFLSWNTFFNLQASSGKFTWPWCSSCWWPLASSALSFTGEARFRSDRRRHWNEAMWCFYWLKTIFCILNVAVHRCLNLFLEIVFSSLTHYTLSSVNI